MNAQEEDPHHHSTRGNIAGSTTSATTPPIFLAHAYDDPTADVAHSLRLAAAMHAAKRPVEMHLFQRGGHSWGLGKPGDPVAAWPRLFSSWARANGWLASDASEQ